MPEYKANQDIKNLLKTLENKEVFILTKFGMRYRTLKIQVGEDSITFFDKFGTEIFLSIDQIAQIAEVWKNGN